MRNVPVQDLKDGFKLCSEMLNFSRQKNVSIEGHINIMKMTVAQKVFDGHDALYIACEFDVVEVVQYILKEIPFGEILEFEARVKAVEIAYEKESMQVLNFFHGKFSITLYFIAEIFHFYDPLMGAPSSKKSKNKTTK